MSNYRPIADMWILARAKLRGGAKYYGAYLGGFPERARVLIGASINDPVLHVCGGMALLYPYARAFGPHDQTLDLDPHTKPDFLQNCCDALPAGPVNSHGRIWRAWAGMIADPPYSREDAANYAPGAAKYPAPGKIVERMIAAIGTGGRVGIIHYIVPKCPKNAKFVACVGVVCGFNNRIRVFSVFERVG